MCYILAYVIFIPIAKELSSRLNYPPISTATALALGAVASFNLVYPSPPVIISAAEELSANRDMLILLGFLTAVPTSFSGYLYARSLGKAEVSGMNEGGVIREKTIVKEKKDLSQEMVRCKGQKIENQEGLKLMLRFLFLYFSSFSRLY